MLASDDGSIPPDAGWLADRAASVPTDTIRERDAEFVAQRQGEVELDAFLDAARNQIKGLQVTPLGILVTVQRGTSYRKGDTTETAGSDAALIRVGDLQDGELKSVTLTYDGDDLPADRYAVRDRRHPALRLRHHRKVAVVPQAFDGAFATSGLVTLRIREDYRESLRPAYLAAVLGSAVYRDWLDGHARGGYIRHLSPSAVDRLRVPVPTLDQQDRLVGQAASGADAAEVLLAVGEASAPDPLKSWLLSVPTASAAGATVGGLGTTAALMTGGAKTSALLATLGGGALAAGGGGMAAGAMVAMIGAPVVGGAIAA